MVRITKWGGGKTLIGGTAYSIMTTKEVENTVVVSGYTADKREQLFTVYSSKFDWSKYRLKTLVVTGDAVAAYNGMNESNLVMFFVYDNYGSTKSGILMYGTPTTCTKTVDTTTNGRLTIGENGTSGVFRKSFYCAILEAKT